MTSEQADELYVGIVTLLREERLDWIVGEVESSVREGKTVASEIPLEVSPELRPSRTKRTSVTRHSQREWTPEERLALLLDAVDAAVCGPVRMEYELVGLLPELDGHEIVFAPGGFGEELPEDLFREKLLRVVAIEAGDPLFRPYEPYAIRLDRGADERRIRASRLAGLIQGVRRELNADLD
ncbi:MAG: hypothetical protein NTV70_19940 [Acidobacteria bacterium]|nr:hypothetical protein [Acidobacteriota bacterium]